MIFMALRHLKRHPNEIPASGRSPRMVEAYLSSIHDRDSSLFVDCSEVWQPLYEFEFLIAKLPGVLGVTIRNLLLEGCSIFAEHQSASADADKFFVRLKPSERFLGCLAALRAGNGQLWVNDIIVGHRNSPCVEVAP